MNDPASVSAAEPARAHDPARGRKQTIWLLAGLLLAAAPHLPRLPPWISAAFLAFLIWKALGDLRGWPLPGPGKRALNAVKQVLAIAIFAGVYFGYGGGLGREAGVALLVVLLGLKVLEIKEARDHYVAALLGLFLVVTNFFYSQTIATAGHMLAVVIVTVTGLIDLNDRGGRLRARTRLRLATTLIAQALPLMLIAFVLFPRTTGPLWGLPKDAFAGISGLSDTMMPGSISELTLSDAVAFRAEFGGARPAPSQLYWRGPVMWRTDGRTWSAGAGEALPPVAVVALGDPVQYTVTLEPHDTRWLFVLDMPTQIPAQGRVTGDFQVLARTPVRSRMSYTATSHLRYRVTATDARERDMALQLPKAAHAETAALARGWRAETADDAQLVERALRYFREEPFYYTLQPPVATGDSVDDFMFRSRRGFCEHYAASFTVLMRAAGIPARIVTGYQGGEFNPIGGYLIVRARDAHAWSEVWLPERGWVRVDPTAAVSPARIERGIDQALPEVVPRFALGLEASPAMQEAWARLRNQLDALNYGWNRWVLGYNARRQSELLAGLGVTEADESDLVFTLVGIAAAMLLVLAVWMARSRRTRRDPVRAAYDRYCARLARTGLARAPTEGPLDYARRAARSRADLAAQIHAITSLYVALRYGPEPASPASFYSAVRRFRV